MQIYHTIQKATIQTQLSFNPEKQLISSHSLNLETWWYITAHLVNL